MSILSDLLSDIFLKKKSISLSHEESVEGTVAQLIEFGSAKLRSGDVVGAEQLCAEALALSPNHPEAYALLADVQFMQCLDTVKKRFPGPGYLEWLVWFHSKLKPESYLEIGVESGQSLQYARSPTRAVGVDPAIQIVYPQENWVKLFKLPSDEFFVEHDPRQVFGTETIHLSFVDGLHTFDQALKDFINIERFSGPNSVVLFHDVFPVIPATAQRERIRKFWVGDTWKVMQILRKYRPDLRMFTIPTYPSGLGVVTGLNPDSTILKDDLDKIIQEAFAWELDDFQPKIDDHLHLVANDFDAVARHLDI